MITVLVFAEDFLHQWGMVDDMVWQFLSIAN